MEPQTKKMNWGWYVVLCIVLVVLIILFNKKDGTLNSNQSSNTETDKIFSKIYEDNTNNSQFSNLSNDQKSQVFDYFDGDQKKSNLTNKETIQVFDELNNPNNSGQ